jgi:hypothetical protein
MRQVETKRKVLYTAEALVTRGRGQGTAARRTEPSRSTCGF